MPHKCTQKEDVCLELAFDQASVYNLFAVLSVHLGPDDSNLKVIQRMIASSLVAYLTSTGNLAERNI